MPKINRAYSILTVKAVNEAERTITGIATTPTPDRIGDIVEPTGAEFNLPIPLLWQHDSQQPIGEVTRAKVTKAGIEITAKLAKIQDPPLLRNRLEEAWASIKAGLVRGLSIGFKPLESADIADGPPFAERFIRWLWLELSAVTIPANAEATIETVKSLDKEFLAAHGRDDTGERPATLPGATGTRTVKCMTPEELNMSGKKTIAEQISAYEATRAAKAARMNEIMEESGEAGETLDEAQQEEWDTLAEEVKAADQHIKRLRDQEELNKTTLKPAEGKDVQSGAGSRAGISPTVRMGQDQLPKGIRFARVAKLKALARMDGRDVEALAKQLYPDDALVQKAAVEAGTHDGATWAGPLVGAEGDVFGDFAEFLRPMTIIGKFGMNGIPALRQIPFRTRLPNQTSGGSAQWVGEGKAKPLTSLAFGSTTLDETKIATISVITEELLRRSSPSAEMLLRDELAFAVRDQIDADFSDPSNAGITGVKPASITNGATTTAASGTDADAVRTDIKVLIQAFLNNNNPLESGVFLMRPELALTLSLMVNTLGQREFPDIRQNGGFLLGIPVITSNSIPKDSTSPSTEQLLILVNAGDIYLADEGGIAVDMSRETALEMSDAPTSGAANTDSPSGSHGASLVSMFQANAVAFRAERTIGWTKRRSHAVQVINDIAYAI